MNTMPRLNARWILVALAVFQAIVSGSIDLNAQTVRTADRANDARVILITLDGARTEEMFGGLDAAVYASTLKPDTRLEAQPLYQHFWAATREERRQKLMPFFWGTLMTQHGSIAGDVTRGSEVRLTNRQWFSYPGYAEILTGEAHDDTITSNDPIRNPYETVLEAIGRQQKLPPASVATFASWSVFNAIAEHTPGATTINAGVAPYAGGDAATQALNRAQSEVQPHWGDVRFDYFTFELAMAHLASARPRVLYLAFDETDDWAHDRRYDRLLEAYARIDRYLERLWTWVQSQPDYRGRTHILITTDHGRGDSPADWHDHGAKIPGAVRTWIAIASPDVAKRGVWSQHPPLTTSQIAATLARWMGVDWRSLHPSAGAPIDFK